MLSLRPVDLDERHQVLVGELQPSLVPDAQSLDPRLGARAGAGSPSPSARSTA